MKKDYFNVSVRHRVEENGVEVFKTHTYQFKKSGVTFPPNAMHKLMPCRKLSRILYLYLCEIMDQMNTVTNNEQLKAGFKLQLKKMGCKQYKDDAINKGFTELKKVGLLISTPKKGMSHVNPKHAFKAGTSLKDRKALLTYFLMLLTNPEWDNTNLIEALGRYSEE